MTTVPSKKTTSVSVNRAPETFQSPSNVPAGAFDGGGAGFIAAGKQLENFSDKAAATLLKIQEDDNEAEAKELDNQMADALRHTLYGSGEENDVGYLGTERKTAMDGYVPTEDSINKTVETIAGSASNDAVKRLAKEMGAVRARRAFDTMIGHLGKQRVAYHDDLSEARTAQARSDAAMAWRDHADTPERPSTLTLSLGIATEENTAYAERHSLDETSKKRRLVEQHTVIVQGAVEAALGNDAVADAKAILDKHGPAIDGVIKAKLVKALEAGEVREVSQRETARIQAANAGDFEAQIEAAKKIKDPKVQDAVIEYLDRDHSRDERMKNERRKEEKDKAWAHIKGGGAVDELSPVQLAEIDGTTYEAMRRFEKNRAKRGSGFALASKPEVANTLHRLFMDDKEKFVNTDLTQYAPDLEEQDYEYWQQQQRSVDMRAEKEAASAKKKQANYVLADRMAKEYLNAAGIGYGASAKEDDPAKANKVFGLVREIVDEAHSRGEVADRALIDRELANLFITGEVQGSGILWDDTGRSFEFVGTGELANFEITDIDENKEYIHKATGVPRDNIEDIVAALKQQGVPVTAANIQKTYEAAVANARTGGR